MKIYTESEIANAVAMVTDNENQVSEVIAVLHRINEDTKFAKDLGLNQSLHLKNVLLGSNRPTNWR
jgi:hypothetical protein